MSAVCESLACDSKWSSQHANTLASNVHESSVLVHFKSEWVRPCTLPKKSFETSSKKNSCRFTALKKRHPFRP